MLLRPKFHGNRTMNGRVKQDFVHFKMAAAAILDVVQTTLTPLFSEVCIIGATFQISSKLDNTWPSYTRFCEIQDGSGGHLESGAERRFYQFSVEYVTVVLHFKFHRNQRINGRVMRDFVQFKMAAAAILKVVQNAAFTNFQ